MGWTHDADFRAAEAAGDWLEAFHFADSKRDTDYTIKYLPRGQQYWFIVGATNERFTEATYSEWTSITTTADSTTATPMPAATPTPTPTPTPMPLASEWIFFETEADAITGTTKLKPRWDVHLSGDDDQLG